MNEYAVAEGLKLASEYTLLAAYEAWHSVLTVRVSWLIWQTLAATTPHGR
jgi:hypothetical protein